jgi:succinate dehydrogenase / fumarate reductase flavoprotein subunit
MSESLRNDGRIWVPKKAGDDRHPNDIPEDERDYYLERRYPAFGNLVPRDVASRAAKERCDAGYGVGSTKMAVYLDFRDAIQRLGKETIEDRYGNLFQMYEKIAADNPYEHPMRIYPAVHYTMGGLWVDYNLMSNLPGLFVLGEANFSDHGANRLGASALMQGLADGYFVIPYTIGNYLAGGFDTIDTGHPAFEAAQAEVAGRTDALLALNGKKTIDEFHRELGIVLWDKCGMSRTREGLEQAIGEIRELRDAFWQEATVTGSEGEFNQTLERAGRIADYLEFAELMVRDALHRDESCGGHFREEYQTEDGEALRNDAEFTYAAAWEFAGVGQAPELHKEPLVFEEVHPTTRSYK